MDDDYKFICKFENKCQQISEGIIGKICKRVIKRLNKEMKDIPNVAGTTDDYPNNFNFCDILSVELQNKSYDETNPTGFLEDYIGNVLMDEYSKLSTIERFVLDYSECSEFNECDFEKSFANVRSKFYEMIDNHYYISKIQKFTNRW